MSTVASLAAVLLMSTAPTQPETCSLLQVQKQPISFGFRAVKNRQIDTVVLHSIHDPAHKHPYHIDTILALMKRYRVSAHYVIARDGMVHQLVEETHISFHAGKSLMPSIDGRSSVNRFSVGIELIYGYNDRPTDAQYCALEALLVDIKRRHVIKHVVAHGEVAGERRTDPWNFDWSRIKK